MRGEIMNSEQHQEIIELFLKTSYMKYHEILKLLRYLLPDRSKSIIRILDDDIRQFKLKVYFWEVWNRSGPRPLLEPEYVTLESIGYLVQPLAYHDQFWLHGDFSTKEFKEWLQGNDFMSLLLEELKSHLADRSDDELSKLTAAVNEPSSQTILPPPATPSCSSDNGERTLITVNIPASLWAGKSPKAIFAVLSEKGFAPEVIAYVLMEKVGGISKTDAGRLFSQEDIAKGVEQEPRTYQRKIDGFLNDAKSKYSFIFEG